MHFPNLKRKSALNVIYMTLVGHGRVPLLQCLSPYSCLFKWDVGISSALVLLRDASSFYRHLLHKKTTPLTCFIPKKHAFTFKFFCRDSCWKASQPGYIMPEPPMCNFSPRLMILFCLYPKLVFVGLCASVYFTKTYYITKKMLKLS